MTLSTVGRPLPTVAAFFAFESAMRLANSRHTSRVSTSENLPAPALAPAAFVFASPEDELSAFALSQSVSWSSVSPSALTVGSSSPAVLNSATVAECARVCGSASDGELIRLTAAGVPALLALPAEFVLAFGAAPAPVALGGEFGSSEPVPAGARPDGRLPCCAIAIGDCKFEEEEFAAAGAGADGPGESPGGRGAAVVGARARRPASLSSTDAEPCTAPPA